MFAPPRERPHMEKRAFVLMPVVLIRHFKAIERAEVEHERSAYLATHDVLTQLPSAGSVIHGDHAQI